MTLNELKQQEVLIDEEYELLNNRKIAIEKHINIIDEVSYLYQKNEILDRIFDNSESKIECLKAQIKLLTN